MAEAPGPRAPAAPQPSARPAPGISHAFLPRAQRHEVPVRYASPAPPQAPASDTGARATVAPVVTAARIRHGHTDSARSPWARFARASTRASTLLAVGGALAAVALFATLGIAVGERSGRPAPSPASLQAVSPVVAETRPPVPVASVPQQSSPSFDRGPAEPAANRAILNAETTTIAAPPVVHPAPATAPAKGPAAAPSGAMSGWAIAPTGPATPPEVASAPGAQVARGAVNPAGSPTASAASAPESRLALRPLSTPWSRRFAKTFAKMKRGPSRRQARRGRRP